MARARAAASRARRPAALDRALAAEQPPASADTTQPSFGSIFTGLGHDFARLPSTGNFLTLAGGGVLAQAVHHEDASLALRANASEPLDEMFDGGASTGSGWVQVGGAFGVYAVGRMTGHVARDRRSAPISCRRSSSMRSMTHSIKFAVDRTRPDLGHHSFPSGHTSSTFATATVLQRQLGWKVGIPAYVVATYVGASRMTENRHFASDVIFGAAIGVVAGRTVTVGHGAARFALSPAIVPGGAAVTLSRTPYTRASRAGRLSRIGHADDLSA